MVKYNRGERHWGLMVNFSAHTKHKYLAFQLKQHNTRQEKGA